MSYSPAELSAEAPEPGDVYGRLALLDEQCRAACFVVVLLALVAVAEIVVLLKLLKVVTTIVVPGVEASGTGIPSYF